jgi:hypothetical protein
VNKQYRKSEEFQEIVELASKSFNSHPTHQFSRFTKKGVKHRLKDFKEFTFKSTGRKILMDLHTWGVGYITVDDIIL